MSDPEDLVHTPPMPGADPIPPQNVPVPYASALLGPRDDLDSLRASFAHDGRVVVPGVFVDDFALALQACLAEWSRWALVTRIEGVHRNFDAAAMAAMTAEDLRPLQALIARETYQGMQYLYERFPVHDVDYEPGPLPPALERVRDLLRAGPLTDLARTITGFEDIAFGDGQATRFRAGHFLTRHDDAHPGKQRRAAYVLGLSTGWRPDDGGQLQFLDEDDRVAHALVPQFNTLTLFRVPRPHLVTAVSPFTEGARLSITGWMRAS